jgi:hypothetical protein
MKVFNQEMSGTEKSDMFIFVCNKKEMKTLIEMCEVVAKKNK